MRRLVERDPLAACGLLGLAVTVAPRVLQASMPSGTLSADLILDLGERRLAHVEYMRKVTGDLVSRMLIYRGLIMREHPRARVTQHVIVLGEGRVRGYTDLAGQGFALDLGVLYLRDLDPDAVLDDPGLAPLAALCRGGPAERAAALGRAFRVIRDKGGDRIPELLEFAAVMATIRLDAPTIGKIVKEAGMTIESIALQFLDTEFGQAIMEQGRTEGRTEGRVEGRVELFTALLREHFGDQDDVLPVAQRLAGWPDSAAAVHAISAASTLHDLDT